MTAYCTDDDLYVREPDLLNFVPATQSGFLPQREEAARIIQRDLLKDRTITALAQIGTATEAELKTAAICKSLQLIFKFLKANPNDQFAQKEAEYEDDYKTEYRDMKGSLSLDIDEDGTIDAAETGVDHTQVLRRW